MKTSADQEQHCVAGSARERRPVGSFTYDLRMGDVNYLGEFWVEGLERRVRGELTLGSKDRSRLTLDGWAERDAQFPTRTEGQYRHFAGRRCSETRRVVPSAHAAGDAGLG